MKKLKIHKLYNFNYLTKLFKKIDWLTFLKYLPLFALFLFLYIYKLTNLMPVFSKNELAFNTPKMGLHTILDDPRYLPIKIVRYLLGIFNSSVSIFEVRLASVIFGFLTILMMYLIIRSWLGRRAAVIGTILFSFSAWTLHVSRLGTYSIMYLFSITLFIYSINIFKKYYLNAKLFLIITALIWPLLITVPGMIYFVIYALIRHRTELKEGIKNVGKLYIINILSIIILLGILTKYIYSASTNILGLLYLPTSLHRLSLVPINFVKTIYHLFLFGPNNPELWMNKAPVLDILILTSSIFGIYFYINHRKKSPANFLFIIFLISIVLTSFNDPSDLSLIVPIVYIFSATGIALFIQRWIKVFPKNPIARILGIGLVLAAVSLSAIYNFRAYFVAWPHDNSTKSYFNSND